MLRLLYVLIIFQSIPSFAQTLSYKGNVVDEKGIPISYVTVALLEPTDSTLSFYSVTNSEGKFEVKNITAGTFILQATFLGYKTYYQTIKFPLEKDVLQTTIAMELKPVNLPAADISAERIPLLIRGDTIEYNASSYKTKPDATIEDLLKKLPGVVVDRQGNIKAQGEEIRKVTVDGKEFFGNDPKIATRNLPADAVDKVQVFDTKSDQAELTGINDGKRDKTINLQLKDDKKSAWFGDVQAGAGSKNHYQSSAKAYRFTPEKQIAFLGMLNNINKFGFSFSDYMNFNGGFRAGGASFKVSTDDNSFPIDFGNVENGLITSGAAGANYSVEARKDNRFNISYLANGINKEQNQQEATTNFTGTIPFYTNNNSFLSERNRANRVNFGWKNRIDTTHTFTLNGQGSINGISKINSSSLINSTETSTVSVQQGDNQINGNSSNLNIHSTFLNKMYSKWKLFSLELDGLWQHKLSQNEINTFTKFYSPEMELMLSQFQENKKDFIKYSADAGIMRKMGESTYLLGNISAGRESDMFSRQQGLLPVSDGIIDSLSGALKLNYQWIEPRIKFKLLTKKNQFSLSIASRMINLNNNFNNISNFNFNKIYFLPTVNWEREYKSSHRIQLFYETSVLTPNSTEFFPLTNYFDPLNLLAGNQSLKPEVHNDFRFHWSIFDQFSFTSFFANLRFSYIKDKISWNKTISNNLVQKIDLLNVPDDIQLGASAEYSTPIRKLGVNITLSVDESWNSTLSYINGQLNKSSSLTHELGISFDNRKKNKWDISAGVNVRLVRSLFSILSIPKQSFIRGNVFSDISFNPTNNWQFSIKADLSNYYGQAFKSEFYIPLLQVEASHTFLKHKKGVLSLTAVDLLNRNTGIERISEYNYLRESKSDIIKRYVMLSFRYKLNKFKANDNIDVKINGH